jgi:hypothetical protein
LQWLRTVAGLVPLLCDYGYRVQSAPATYICLSLIALDVQHPHLLDNGSTGAVGRHNNTPDRAAFGTFARGLATRVPLFEKAKFMELPEFLEGQSLTRLLQGAAVGAVATMVVGFNWGGWSLGSAADKMAKERSDLAVVAALAPVCADKFRALPDAQAKEVALSKLDSWKRQDEFPKDLVTLPGDSYPSSALVDACSILLLAPKAAALN